MSGTTARDGGRLVRVGVALVVLLPLVVMVWGYVEARVPLGDEVSHEVESTRWSSRLYASSPTPEGDVIGVGYRETSPNVPAAWATTGVGRPEPRAQDLSGHANVQLWGVASDDTQIVAVGRRWMSRRERAPVAFSRLASGRAVEHDLVAPEGNAIARAVAALDGGGFVVAGTTWPTEFGDGAAACRGERSSMVVWTGADGGWEVRYVGGAVREQCAQAVIVHDGSVVVAGYRDGPDGRSEGVLLRFDSDTWDGPTETVVPGALFRSLAVHRGELHAGGSTLDGDERRTAAVWRLDGTRLERVDVVRTAANRVTALASDGRRLWATGGGATQGAPTVWSTEPGESRLVRLEVDLESTESLQSLTYDDGRIYAFGSADPTVGDVRGAVVIFTGLGDATIIEALLAFWPVPLLVVAVVGFIANELRTRTVDE